MSKKVVLAYSGGLDTSCAIKWLTNKGYEVVAYMADVGQERDFALTKKRALKAGAKKVIVEDLKREFVTDFIFKSLKANAVYGGGYLLATALSRPLIAKGLVRIASKEKTGYVAHGCTGKGNDQVRFEVTIGALNPKLKIIAPVREWELKTRAQEIRYAKVNRIPISVTKKRPYSIDLNLWGASIECGRLEDPNLEPERGVFQLTKGIDAAPAKPTYVEIYFEKGIPKRFNGHKYDGVALISKLNKIGGEHGIGRSDIVEDRLVGIKSREVYEAPAATVLYTAHRAMESLVLDRELAHFKDTIALKYSELVYYGLWYTPLKEALDKFVDETQKRVNGAVRLKLHKANCIIVGRRSPDSLYRKELATYEDGDKFDQSLAKGFIELWGLPYKR